MKASNRGVIRDESFIVRCTCGAWIDKRRGCSACKLVDAAQRRSAAAR